MVLVGLGVVTWLLARPTLARGMRRRGYDPTPWLLLGLLLPPAAVVLALVELLRPAPNYARVVRPGRVLPGGFDVLVNLDSSTRALEAAATVLAALRPRLRTLGLARVLPRGCGRLWERQVTAELCRDAEALGVPGAQLMVLFGRPQDALLHYGRHGQLRLVVTAEQPRLAQALRQSGQVAVAARRKSPLC